jgi:hypothetical protein
VFEREAKKRERERKKEGRKRERKKVGQWERIKERDFE